MFRLYDAEDSRPWGRGLLTRMAACPRSDTFLGRALGIQRALMVRPGPRATEGICDSIPNAKIHPELLEWQWENLYNTLRQCGVWVKVISDGRLLSFADSLFIQDRIAVRRCRLCPVILYAYPRPSSRKPEVYPVMKTAREILRSCSDFVHAQEFIIDGDGTGYHDFGDQIPVVTRDSRKLLFVGQSRRTSPCATVQLREILEPDWRVIPVAVRDVPPEQFAALHLDSAATYLGNDVVILRPGRVDPQPFLDAGLRVKTVCDMELSGAAVIVIPNFHGVYVIIPEECPDTVRAVKEVSWNYPGTIIMKIIPLSEMLKLQAGPGCLLAEY